MYRETKQKLIDWKNRKQRKPLLITGVRQCGKTYLMEEFGAEHFDHILRINFERNEVFGQVFERDYDPDRILQELGYLIEGKPIDPEQTLVIFDEIQACPRAITALKYFAESSKENYILCAGSLLGVEIKRKGISFPVGKIERIRMFPLSFREFVKAAGGERYLQLLSSYDLYQEIPSYVTEPMLTYLKQYFIIGGMPAVVQKWIDTQNYDLVDEQQDMILRDYKDDFSNHAEIKDVLKIGWVWDSLPKQLAKENNKFVFSHVKEGARARDLEDALTWLIDAGLAYKLEKVEHPEIPLSTFSDAVSFKVYMADTGLLRKKAGVSYKTILTEPESYVGFKGAMAENYCLQELIVQNITPYYWHSGNTSEVDFLFESGDQIIPMETKSADNTKAKSFMNYLKKYDPAIGFRVSTKNIGDNQKGKTHEISLPLYLLWRIKEYI